MGSHYNRAPMNEERVRAAATPAQTVIVQAGESLQDAIDSITDATSEKTYLVLVYPGVSRSYTPKDNVNVVFMEDSAGIDSRGNKLESSLPADPTNKSSADYWTILDNMQSGYLDGLWDETRQRYADDKLDVTRVERVGGTLAVECYDSTDGTNWTAGRYNGTNAPANAVDDDARDTYWIGTRHDEVAGTRFWRLHQKFANARTIGRTRIQAWSFAPFNKLLTWTLQYSTDGGTTWTNAEFADGSGDCIINTPQQAVFEQVIYITPVEAADWQWLIYTDQASSNVKPWVYQWRLYENDFGWPFSYTNMFMLGYFAIKAKHGRATATDKARAKAVLQLMTTKAESNLYNSLLPYSCTGGVLKSTNGHPGHIVGWDGGGHTSVDQPFVECMYMAWKYADQLGLSAAEKQSIVDTIAAAPTLYTQDISDTSPSPNQSVFRWRTVAAYLAAEMGIAGAIDEVSTGFSYLEDYFDTAPPDPKWVSPFVNKGFGWYYSQDVAQDAAQSNWNSFEYPEMCWGGLAMYYARMLKAGATPLDATTTARLKMMGRKLLGRWMLSGYPNWDTGGDTYRANVCQYWCWSLRL
ncbi:MAG TPA: hypothetical protein PLU88_14560, partial [Armatimonadota bacterium]|nr:hypothetical protein [Armatimonadota bacterium]